MIDLQGFRDDPQGLARDLKRRGFEAPVAQVVDLDARRRARLTEVETLKAERNRVSKSIAAMKEAAARSAEIERMRQIGEQIDALDAELRRMEAELQHVLEWIPNRPAAATPDGLN
jgi:seryl-tRNA synthetase